MNSILQSSRKRDDHRYFRVSCPDQFLDLLLTEVSVEIRKCTAIKEKVLGLEGQKHGDEKFQGGLVQMMDGGDGAVLFEFFTHCPVY